MTYSVVICSYNKLGYIERVVRGIRETGVKCELVLSDDGSDDGTVEWAKSSREFDCILESDVSDDYRLCTVRNRGIDAAKGKIIVLLDADCVPVKDYFSGHDEVFESYPKSLSVGFTRFFDEKGEKLIAEDKRYTGARKTGDQVCPIGWMSAYGGNIAFPKTLWEKAGGFDEIYNGAWGLEDADFAYVLHEMGIPIMASLKTVAHHLRHPRTGTDDMHRGKGPNTEKFKNKHGFSPC